MQAHAEHRHPRQHHRREGQTEVGPVVGEGDHVVVAQVAEAVAQVQGGAPVLHLLQRQDVGPARVHVAQHGSDPGQARRVAYGIPAAGAELLVLAALLVGVEQVLDVVGEDGDGRRLRDGPRRGRDQEEAEGEERDQPRYGRPGRLPDQPAAASSARSAADSRSALADSGRNGRPVSSVNAST